MAATALNLSNEPLGTITADDEGVTLTLNPQHAHEIVHTGKDSAGADSTDTVFVLRGIDLATDDLEGPETTHAQAAGKYPLIAGKSVFIPPGTKFVSVIAATGEEASCGVSRSANQLGNW